MLPVIRVKSNLSLPPQCPGRTRNKLQLTVGPVEWNPLHSYKPHNDDKHALTIQWWGEKNEGVPLPLSTTRKTTTAYPIRRPQKALQCYLTDMGTMTLSLYDKHGDVIGAAAVPGIKRLSENHPVRENAQLRDAVEGYRLGRLPICLELVGLRRRRSSSGSSRSRSRSTSCPRSRSGSKKTNRRVRTNEEKHEPHSQIPISEITQSIDKLLERSQHVHTRIHENISASANCNFQESQIVSKSQLPTARVEVPTQMDLPTVHFESLKPITEINIPVSLGEAKNLPEITLYIPPLPDLSDLMRPITTNDFSMHNKENFHIPDYGPPQYQPQPQSNRLPPSSKSRPREITELILGDQFDTADVSVDYVPSECGSLLDEEILDQIYRVNQHRPKVLEDEPVDTFPPKAVDDIWLRRGEDLQIEVAEIFLPRKKGRPPPSNTEREIDDHYCVELGLHWAVAESKADQLESCRFISNRTKSGKILFKSRRRYKAGTDVSEPLEISIYQRSKFRPKFNKLDTVLVDTAGFSDEEDYIEVDIQGYVLRLSVMIIKEEVFTKTATTLPEQTPRTMASTSHPIVPPLSAGPTSHGFAGSTQPIQLYDTNNANTGRSHAIETSFPISFLLWIKFAEGIPDVREGHGQPTPPLPEIRVKSPLLDEPINCRIGERTNNPQFNHLAEWTRPVLGSELDLLQSSMFAFECWCATAEQGDKFLGLGRITTSGLSSILVGGYAMLCAPKYPMIMADGKIPLRDISSDQVRGYLSVLLAAGTSVQLDHLKNVRSDLRNEVSKQEELQQTIIEESLSSEQENEPEEFIQPSASETSVPQSIQQPEGIPCLITIERVANLAIGSGRLLSVSVETADGMLTTEWTRSGIWNFQLSCLLNENIPDSLMFKLYTCAADISENTQLRDIQSREFGWIEVSMHTLKCGFPCVNGWYTVRSVSGESIGQMKLGIAPTVSPRISIQTKKSISLEKKLNCQPDQMTTTSKALQDQLKQMEDLVNTVKTKQSSLKSLETADTATQITPAASRLDQYQRRENEHQDHLLRVAELQNQQIDIAVRKVNLSFETYQFDHDNDEGNQSTDSEDQDGEHFIEPLVLNSVKEISEASKSTSNPLSSTRIEEDESGLDEVSTIEDDSDAKIEAIVREFSASMTSIQGNIDASKKLRATLNRNDSFTKQDQTSIWSGDEHERTLTSIEADPASDPSERTLEIDSIKDIEEVDEIDDLDGPLDIQWLRASKDLDSPREEEKSSRSQTDDESDIDEDINKDTLRDSDIEQSICESDKLSSLINTQEPDSRNTPVMKPSGHTSIAERALASAQEEIDALSYDHELERPPRSSKPLDSNQTRRLAAIFGIK